MSRVPRPVSKEPPLEQSLPIRHIHSYGRTPPTVTQGQSFLQNAHHGRPDSSLVGGELGAGTGAGAERPKILEREQLSPRLPLPLESGDPLGQHRGSASAQPKSYTPQRRSRSITAAKAASSRILRSLQHQRVGPLVPPQFLTQASGNLPDRAACVLRMPRKSLVSQNPASYRTGHTILRPSTSLAPPAVSRAGIGREPRLPEEPVLSSPAK